MKKRVIATILVALIAISGITVAFAASGKQGYISPKAILPGAITSSHIKDEDITADDIGGNAVGSHKIAADAVNSTDIDNETIDDKDLDDAAIPSVVLNKTGVKDGLTNTWWEDFNTTITTERKMAFIFTYAANLTYTSISDNVLLARACVVDKAENIAYKAEPSPVGVTKGGEENIQRTVTFTNSSVSPGAYYVNVSVRTIKADSSKITDRVFTVIALPTT